PPPGRPASCSRGAWCVGVAKCWLPRPPRPPRATTIRSSGCAKSWIRSPVSSSYSAVPTALRLVLRVETEMHQRVVPLAGFHHYVAAVSAIAAGGAAAGYKLLPAKGHAAVAAIPRLHPDSCFVNKHGS